jgi:YVTN family beta-propeller protein
LDPNWIDFTADGRYAYVSNTASNDVSVIDTAAGKVVATTAVGKSPKRLAVGRVATAR